MEAAATSAERTSDRLHDHEHGALSDTSRNENQARGRKKKHGPHTAGRKPGKKAKEAERRANLSAAGHGSVGVGQALAAARCRTSQRALPPPRLHTPARHRWPEGSSRTIFAGHLSRQASAKGRRPRP